MTTRFPPHSRQSSSQAANARAAIRLAWLLVACCVLAVAPLVMAAPARDVLVIFSNNRLLPANIEVDRAMRGALATSADRNVELFVEFLDRPAFSGPAFETIMATYLRDKYTTRPPEVIVPAGGPALAFLLRNRAQLFPNVPVVHVAVDKSYLRSVAALPPGVVGVPVEYDFVGTIEMALRWHPNTRRLVVVTGAGDGDRAWEVQLRGDIARLKLPPTVEFLAGLPTDALLKRLGGLGDGDVVFTPGYFRDGAGREFAPRDSAARMAAASGAPVYGAYSTHIGTGIVGGRMPTFIEMGRGAARAVNALLDGVAPTALTLPASVPATVQIDWRQVRRWSIREDAIPADAVVHFREPTFWELHRDKVIALATVILLQAALIFALLVERRSRRRTASALDASESRMDLAARAARLSVWVWDVSRDKVVNATKLRRQAAARHEPPVRLDRVLEAVHPADREAFDRAVRLAIDRDQEFDIEYRTVQVDGEVRWIAARGRVEKGDGGRLTGVAMDITARKLAELQAERDRSALTHMTRVSLMGQLSASIAHQLNQPLAAILGNAEVARKMLDRDQVDLAELKEICDDIVTEDNRAADVIRRLGALYKRGQLRLAPTDLNELVFETLDLVRTELMTRHVIPATELAPALPAIEADRVQLQQVLLNLILNAADAMTQSEASLRNLLIRTDLVGTDVQVCVVDQGPGIAAEDLKNVFEAFWSTKAGGIGVGLAICQSIVKAHHGAIKVTNNPSGGATFCATLPARMQA